MVFQPPTGAGQFLEDIDPDFGGLDEGVDLGFKGERLIEYNAKDFHGGTFGKWERNVLELGTLRRG